MPAAASLLLVSSLLAQPHATPAPVAPAITGDLQGGQAEPRTTPPSTPRPHHIGVGGQMSLSTRGAGGAFRAFFGDQLGVNLNLNIGWARSAYQTSGSTVVVAPSVVYMITKSKQLAEIDLRPYVGGGVNYTNTSMPAVRTTNGTYTGSSGWGMQAFGGLEMSFREVKGLTISGEVAHYQTSVNDFASGVQQGTNVFFMVHYYFK